MEKNGLMDMLSQSAMGTPGMGRADDVPAMLSEGEYVIPADVVAMIGDGNNEAGGKILDQFVAKIRTNAKGSAENPKTHQAYGGKLGNGAEPQRGQP